MPRQQKSYRAQLSEQRVMAHSICTCGHQRMEHAVHASYGLGKGDCAYVNCPCEGFQLAPLPPKPPKAPVIRTLDKTEPKLFEVL